MKSSSALDIFNQMNSLFRVLNITTEIFAKEQCVELSLHLQEFEAWAKKNNFSIGSSILARTTISNFMQSSGTKKHNIRAKAIEFVKETQDLFLQHLKTVKQNEARNRR